MAEKWYPVVDILTCEECGRCVDFCTHGVFDKKKAPSPVVINPVGCVDHCRGCGNQCPQGAITYVGDNTGWIAPALVSKSPKVQDAADSACGCSCSCGANDIDEEIIHIEYLYLDLNTCDRCIGTDKVLEEVLEELNPALKLAGYSVEFEKKEIANTAMAEEYRFLSSPTIRVDGVDICDMIEESDCTCCNEISGSSVDCRVFTFKGKQYEVPPKEMLARGILHRVFVDSDTSETENYTLPENLKTFFEGKRSQTSCCSCDSDCC